MCVQHKTDKRYREADPQEPIFYRHVGVVRRTAHDDRNTPGGDSEMASVQSEVVPRS